jgi:hypothetical protein
MGISPSLHKIAHIIISGLAWFYGPGVGWGCVWTVALFLSTSVKYHKNKYKNFELEVNPEAKKLFNQYKHYYGSIGASTAYSDAASFLQLASIILIIIGVIQGFFWGILIGIFTMFWTGYVADQYSPINRVTQGTAIWATHGEILGALQKHKLELIESCKSK